MALESTGANAVPGQAVGQELLQWPNTWYVTV